MSTSILRRTLRAPLLALALLATPVAAADDLHVTAKYAITLGGTNIAQANVTLDDAGGNYTMAADAKISGLAQLVANGTLRLGSAGASNAKGLSSRRFELMTRTSGEVFTVAISYTGSGVESFVVDPPIVNNIDRVAIEAERLAKAPVLL